MTPALAQTSVFSTLSTRAMIEPLPVRLEYDELELVGCALDIGTSRR